jgi:hypothetical protein
LTNTKTGTGDEGGFEKVKKTGTLLKDLKIMDL